MSKAILSLLFCTLVPFLSALHAQTHTVRYTAMTSKTNAYYEYLPQGYTAAGTVLYPLIIYIHGNSERGLGDSVDMLKITGRGLPKVMQQAGFPTSFTVNSRTYRFIVIAPQFAPRPQVLDIDSVLTYVLKHYPIDLNRVYLTGFSMGGGACWDYAGSIPAFVNKLAAIIPVSGSGVPDTIKTRLMAKANLPIWATHNDSDFTVPVSTTNTYISLINKAPAPIPFARKTIFHSTSHNAWAATYNPNFRVNGLNVFEWMLQYRRRPLLRSGLRQVKVNVFGGLNPFPNVEWNNWNVSTTLTCGPLRYNDATAAPVYALLSRTGSVNDNGISYGGGMAPAEVLRYASNATAVRTLTLSGLSTLKTYNLALYASRNNYSGNVTVFTLNGVSQSISTYKNLTAKALFTNLVPNAQRQLVVSIKNENTYNYLNGFVLTETSSTNQVPTAYASFDRRITLPLDSVLLRGSGWDADGTIISYSWTKLSGTGGTILSPAAPTTVIKALQAGTYTFRLTVKDDKGATANDTVRVIVMTASDFETL